MTLFKKILNIKLHYHAIGLFALFAATIFVFPGKGLDNNQNALFSVASFLFSIYIGFSINNQRTRFNDIFDADRDESSILYSIYMLAKGLPNKEFRAIQELIDTYLVEQIDFLLTDYEKTDDSFSKLAAYCLALKTTNEEEVFIKDKIADLLPTEQEKRYRLQSLLKETVSTSEWVTLGGLYLVTLYFILSFHVAGIATYLVVCLLATAASMLLLTLYKFDSLLWRIQDKIWQPLERLFLQMDLLPYYPKPALDSGAARPTPGTKVRVATFANPYPDIKNKTIKIVKF